ncbi:MAG: amidohydrolase family protein [Acidobacteria bacterium]|nr:amidohydrolase family protein [Acidobacteriota bacterium]
MGKQVFLGKAPARFAWGYTGSDMSFETLSYVAGLLGIGSDHFWNVGAWAGAGGSCTTINARPEVKAREQCSFAPGSQGREILERIIKAGGRIATMHSYADKDIDYLMDAVEIASREAGFTVDQIRAKRHAFDHSSGAPRPDQIPRIKMLGMMTSMINTVLWEDRTDYDMTFRVRNYGIEYAGWTVPRKSVNDAGVMHTFEIDRWIPEKTFFFIHKGMTRFNDKDQRVYGPAERTDRVTQLKALTRWGGYYLLRENVLGTLEPRKYADFIVLDRDFLTIPEDEIPQTKVLMTVVGGKTVHLISSLAREVGMQPTGATTW